MGKLARLTFAFLLLFNLTAQLSSAHAQGTVFTYQGQLLASGGSNYTGLAQIAPSLWDAATNGNQVGTNNPISVLVGVTNGLFNIDLDFGSAPFKAGTSRWLQFEVRTTLGPFTTLSSRQPLSAVPYAITANHMTIAASTKNFSGSPVTTAGKATNGSSSSPTGMVLIRAGSFTMGDTLDGGMGDAVPVTDVYISAFYMDTKEVSYSLWKNVYSYAISHGYSFAHAGSGKAYNHPVQRVDWYDCVKWCNARSQQAGLTPVYYTDADFTQIFKIGEVATIYPNWSAKGYRLPTEAEWEKAARGGLSRQRFPWGNTISESQANYYSDTNRSYDLGPNGYNVAYATGSFPFTSPVGSFAPNGYGLFDMAGNVWEWCWDWYGTTYAGGANPTGPSSGSARTMRGGGWGNHKASGAGNSCRIAERLHGHGNPSKFFSDSFGFRTVLPAGQ